MNKFLLKIYRGRGYVEKVVAKNGKKIEKSEKKVKKGKKSA
jgi:hypothetical protein